MPMSQTKCRIPLYEWKKNGREMMNLPEVFNHTGRSAGGRWSAGVVKGEGDMLTVDEGDDVCGIDGGEYRVEQVGHCADV